MDVVAFQKHDHGGKEYAGYDISFDADYRHYKADLYSLWTVPGQPNWVLFERPSRASIYEPGNKDEQQYEAQETHEAVKRGHQKAGVAISNAASRKRAKFLLKFPDGVELSNDAFRINTERGDKYYEAQPFIIKFRTGDKDRTGKDIISFSCRLSYKVLDMKSGETYKGSANAAAKALADRISGMDLGDDTF